MHFQSEAIKITREKLSNNKSLIGFVGGFWTLMNTLLGIIKRLKFQKFYPKFLD